MKHCILGFSQSLLIEMGLKQHKIDLVDLHILEWFSDWTNDRTMCNKEVYEEKMIGGKKTQTKRTFYWIKYDTVADVFPFFIETSETVRKRFQKMVKAGILDKRIVKRKDEYFDRDGVKKSRKVLGSLTYFAIQPLYYELRAAANPKIEGR